MYLVMIVIIVIITVVDIISRNNTGSGANKL